MPLDPDDRWIFYVHDPEQNLVAECYDARAASALLALYGAGTRVTATTHAHRDIIWCEGLDDLVAPVGALVSDILQHRLENLVYTRRECRFWDDGKHCTNVTDIARELCPEHLPPGRDEERAREEASQARLDALVAEGEEHYRRSVLHEDDDEQHFPDCEHGKLRAEYCPSCVREAEQAAELAADNLKYE